MDLLQHNLSVAFDPNVTLVRLGHTGIYVCLISGMQVSVRTPHPPRVAYYRRLPIGSSTRVAIEKYLFSPEEPLSTTEALEVYRYLRDFAGATATGISLREIGRTHIDTIVEVCLDTGADPF